MEINEALLRTAHSAVEDKKGEGITILDISKLSIISDYFLIATGNNQNHIQALADSVEEKLTANGLPLRHKEGFKAASWVLLDFGGLIVHLFDKESREFYDLEHIWGDAEVVTL